MRGRQLPGFGHEKASCRREPTTQPALDHTTEPTTLPAASDPPAPTLPFTASLEATHNNGPATTPHPRIILRLPERLMKRPAVECRDESDEPYAQPNIADYSARSTRSGLMRNGGGGGGSFMLIVQSRFQPIYPAVSSSRSSPDPNRGSSPPNVQKCKCQTLQTFNTDDVIWVHKLMVIGAPWTLPRLPASSA